MSRIGKLPVLVPKGVEVNISDKNLVTVKDFELLIKNLFTWIAGAKKNKRMILFLF